MPASPRQDTEELFSFRRAFEVEIVLADDAFRVPSLKRSLAHGAVFRHEHRNEGVADTLVDCAT